MKYDVIVCGGGIAGVSAALAASRNKAKVLLIEREYALGGLATLGLIAIYLPLCDGRGTKMSSGIAEELLKLSIKYGPGQIPNEWIKNNSSIEEREKQRYEVEFNPASFMIVMEEELLKNGVEILYGTHISGVEIKEDKIKSVIIETKTGKQNIEAKVFVDATGDADICFFAGEKTISDDTNRRTGWYYSYDKKEVKLNKLTDPLYTDIPKESRLYSGTNMKDISQNCIDGRKMILEDLKKKKQANKEVYPILIPTFHRIKNDKKIFTVNLNLVKRNMKEYFLKIP